MIGKRKAPYKEIKCILDWLKVHLGFSVTCYQGRPWWLSGKESACQ